MKTKISNKFNVARVLPILTLTGLLVLGINQVYADQNNNKSLFITLGTNSGPIPNPKRAEPSNVLVVGDQVMVIDAGDGLAWQLAKANIRLGEVDSIFLSHLHFDHTGGLFAFISQRFQMNEQGKIQVYGPIGTKQTIDGIFDAMKPVTQNHGWMLSSMQSSPREQVEVFELTHESELTIEQVKVKVSRNSHYIIAEEDGDKKVRALSFRFDLPDRSIVYTGDTGPSDDVVKLAKGVDLLITEVMDADESWQRIEKGVKEQHDPGFFETVAIKLASRKIKNHFRRQHLSPEEVGQMAQQAGVKALVVTHNAIADELLDEAIERVAQHYQGPTQFAIDLQSF